MATDKKQAVQKSFDKAMEQINKLQRAFREEGLLAKAVAEMGGNTKFDDIQDAMSNLYDALEDGHYDAFSGRSGASMHGESKEKPVKEDYQYDMSDKGDMHDALGDVQISVSDAVKGLQKASGLARQVQDEIEKTLYTDEAKEKPVKEAKTQELMDEVIVQIKRDCDMGDYTAIEELLQSCPEADLRGFLSDIGSPESSGRMNDYSEESVSEASLSLDKAKEYFFRDHDFGEENIGYEYDRISKRMSPEDAKVLKKELQDMYGDSMSESNAVSDLKKLAGLE